MNIKHVKEGVRHASHYSKWMSSKMGYHWEKPAKGVDFKRDNEYLLDCAKLEKIFAI